MQRATSKLSVVAGSKKGREHESKTCRGLVLACSLNAGVFFSKGRDTVQVIGEKRSLNGFFHTKSNLWLLDSDLYSPHNDDIFTVVIGLITSHPSSSVF